ncbi:MAG TPA: hypothetical protein VGD03_13365 [Frankiaceae bacterium]
MELQEIADELYGLPPEEFTATRDARAAEARKAGDRDLATAVRQLKRPSRSAWLANLLARRAGDQLAGLLDLGDALREAQENLAGDALRQLSSQRHQVIYGLAQEGRRLAADAGAPVGDAVERELESTLEAALADPAAAAAVRSGRLVKHLEPRGFDPVDLAGAVALPGDLPAAPPAPAPGPAARKRAAPENDRQAADQAAAREAAEQERRERLARAQEDVDAAEQAAATAERQRGAARERAARARDDATQARERREQAEQALLAAQQDETTAERTARERHGAAEEAERAVQAAQQQLAQARDALHRAGGG